MCKTSTSDYNFFTHYKVKPWKSEVKIIAVLKISFPSESAAGTNDTVIALRVRYLYILFPLPLTVRQRIVKDLGS